MIVGYVLAGIAVLIGVAALRALPRLVNDRRVLRSPFPLAGDQGDAMSHLIMTDLVRRNGHRIPSRAPQYLLGERLDYPLFFHFVMSFVPRRVLDRWEWVVTPLTEGVHAALLFGFAAYLLSRFDVVAAPFLCALAVVTAYAVTPLLTRPWRRTGFFGERSFGHLFGHIYMATLVAYLLTGAWPFAVVAIVAFTVAAASAKFATQAMVFLSVALAALLWDARPILLLVASAVIAIVCSRGYVWTLLRGQIRHSVLYCRHLVHLSDGTKAFSNRDLHAAISAVFRGRPREALGAFRRHPVSRLFSLVPWLAPFAVLTGVVFIAGSAADGVFTRAVLGWGWSSVIVALLTMTDALKFLGEGERYLEYGVFPMALAPLLLPSALGGAWWFLLILYSAIVYVRQLRNGAALSLPSDAAAGVAAFMAQQPPATLYGVPGRLVLPLCYGTDHKAVWHLAHIDDGDRLDRWLSLFANGAVYPFGHPDSARSAGLRHGADLLVVWKSGVKSAAQVWGLHYDLSGHPVVFENDDFIVYGAVASGCGKPASQAAGLGVAEQAAHG